jgi:hypothetical protein
MLPIGKSLHGALKHPSLHVNEFTHSHVSIRIELNIKV